MPISDERLVHLAEEATAKALAIGETREGWKFTGRVGAALVTDRGNVYTGINLDLFCGIGFCAEHSAVAEMVRNGETRIAKIVAIAVKERSLLPPCGRCRELLYQIDKGNLDTEVVLGGGRNRALRDLLPHTWQESFGRALLEK